MFRYICLRGWGFAGRRDKDDLQGLESAMSRERPAKKIIGKSKYPFSNSSSGESSPSSMMRALPMFGSRGRMISSFASDLIAREIHGSRFIRSGRSLDGSICETDFEVRSTLAPLISMVGFSIKPLSFSPAKKRIGPERNGLPREPSGGIMALP